MRVFALWGLCAPVVMLGGACELATHAFDYGVGEATPYRGLCDVCPASAADLRHPVCPVQDSSPDLDQTFVYAARHASFGHAADFLGPAAQHFALGLDLDCSARPGGRPPLCAPDGAAAIPWTALPHGIDNAWLERVLAPVYAAPLHAFDLDAAVSAALEAGHMGVLVSIDHWNGADDDPDVRVTVEWSPGVADGAAPAWDGHDAWARFPGVDIDGSRTFRVESVAGYVRAGVLVVDDRARGAADYRFGTRRESFQLVASDVAFVGTLTRRRLDHFMMVGLADLPSANAAAQHLAASVAGCADAPEGGFVAAIAPLLPGAADMPSDPSAAVSETCDAISFAWSFDAEAALLGQVDDGPGDAEPSCP